MIPLHLMRNPFPNTKWNRDRGSVVVLDGRAYAVRDVEERLSGKLAYVVGADQNDFERLCRFLDVTSIQFYEMKVEDCASISLVGPRELGIHWNTKVSSLEFVKDLPGLEALVLIDTKKTADLEPLSSLKRIRAFEYSGGIWNKQTAESLEPVSRMLSLRYLAFTNIKVMNGGLSPLAVLKGLETLELSNQFETREYAFLSVALASTQCDLFAPYRKLSSPIGGKDLMITGKRKPFLSSKDDKVRVAKYVAQFRALQDRYARST